MKDTNICSNSFEDVLKLATVLYVEDDKSIKDCVIKYFEKTFKTVIVANNGKEALELFIENKIDILVTDIYMAEVDGIELLKNIKSLAPNLPCVVTLKDSNSKNIMDLISLNINHIVVNHLNMKSLVTEIHKAYKITYYYQQLQQKEKEVKKLNSLVENQITDLKNMSVQIIKQNAALDFKYSKSREKTLFNLKYLISDDNII